MESRNWLDLPADVTTKIIQNLSAIKIIPNAQKVCVSWRRICNDSSMMWGRIKMCNLGMYYLDYNLDKMCRHVVDRSNGKLIEININYYIDTDRLLHYIAKRSSGLKRLGLVSSYGISNRGFIGAVAKLPLLEELELTRCIFSKKSLEAVGKYCRLLNSLKLIKKEFSFNGVGDDEALAIAENMLGLRHLQLVRNEPTDDGLRAILNGCPRLKSLDLCGCRYLSFEGNLKKTCAEQVKSLKLPDASMECVNEDNYDRYYGST